MSWRCAGAGLALGFSVVGWISGFCAMAADEMTRSTIALQNKVLTGFSMGGLPLARGVGTIACSIDQSICAGNPGRRCFSSELHWRPIGKGLRRRSLSLGIFGEAGV